LIATFIALTGTAYAFTLPSNSVKSRHIKNGQVKTKDLADRAVSLGKLGSTPVARIDTPRDANGIGGCTFDQQVTDSATSVEPLLFVEDRYDPSDMHAADPKCTNPARSRLMIKATGYYEVHAGVLWGDQTPATDSRFLGVRVNGTRNLAGEAGPADNSGGSTMQAVSDIVHLSAGDYVEAVARTHNVTTPGNRSVFDPRSFLAVVWIGPG
jgi:hypothetical protein